ncbi:MAG: outer membrane lipid asymmetry maintenance protein MlaD [Desulfobacteraceae bacterium]|nr:MAG: outer membrane lipid asymmetry maintenance protein MlaD [Desulfobacteraceae bacterium]
MKRSSVEVWVGIFVIISLVCIGYLSIRLGKVEVFGDKYYSLHARFQSVSGLRPGTHVEMAGVKVGLVEKVALDPQKLIAVVTLKIRRDIQLTDDVIASIKTAGLIGDKYIKLSPGGSDVELKPGDYITETESALDIEELISKYVFGKVS